LGFVERRVRWENGWRENRTRGAWCKTGCVRRAAAATQTGPALLQGDTHSTREVNP